MNIHSFEYTAFPSKVFFGEKSFDNIVKLLTQYQKAFVIAEKRQEPYVDLIKAKAGVDKVFHFNKVVQHVPANLVEEAKQLQQREQTDVLVAIGGGSAIGLAKALALTSNHDIIAVPSTYAGSEMTNIWGITTLEGKTTGRDMRVLPEIVIYDPAMTATMPVALAATSAMNAMAHLMEAVYGHDTNPISYNNSLDGMKKLRAGMMLLAKHNKLTQEANQLLQYGSFLAGKGLCEVSMSLHHKLAHVLGGSFNLDHASVHTVLQAFVLDYQWDALLKEVQQDFCNALAHPYPPEALLALARGMHAPTSLAEIGFKEADIDKTINIALSKPYANPKSLTKEGLTNLLSKAYKGTLNI
ncbi:maleylacetate reductase [Chryseotalea sanaruensis]|uniref:Maleylacetate reductase n=1 Tax=Chryseotalea sanaruensis TaxID=2482724 RepID=A0A401U6M5_9BACT|nr:maleylacetate reductase [Chryseotalea sanaruensis]GCC50502.1 maleylacetate reductase [Chryseotalea sanaruensis]